jgi:hypothetical protein
MAAQRFEVRPQTGTFGAEIAGIDLTQPIDSDTAAELYATWLEYSVLFFRDHDQPITPPQYIAFATNGVNGVEPRFSAKLRFDPYFHSYAQAACRRIAYVGLGSSTRPRQ